MKIEVSDFRGELPRAAADTLPAQFSQRAINARLLNGRLEPWRNFSDNGLLCKLAPINTIYPLRDPSSGNVAWLHWRATELPADVSSIDVAKSIIAGDTTARVYLTGLDVPRWTDYQLATTGTGCPPIQTRPLGVIAPTVAPSVSGAVSTTSPIDTSDDFENDSGWVYSPEINSGDQVRIARRLPSGGNPNGRLQFLLGGGQSMAYAIRDFGVGASASVTVEFDYRLDQKFADQYPTENLWLPKDYQFFTVILMNDADGNGARVEWATREPPPAASAYGRNGSSLSGPGSVVSAVDINDVPPLGTWARVRLDGSKKSSGTYDWRLRITVGSTVIVDVTLQGLPARGGYVGFASPGSIPGHGVQIQSVDNLRVTASAPPVDTSDDVTTSYVYTFVSQVGNGFEESAPSPPSATIVRDDGTTVTITTPVAPPTGLDYNIVAKRIYRAVTGATGTDFYLLAEIPLSQATYDDTTPDRVLVLGDLLRSADWDLPPSDLRGIIALPNGIMAGFRKNELCLSEQGFPHAWPVKYRLATDFDIVGIGAIDTMVVICTQLFPYLAAGNTPGTYSMMKLDIPQGCVSKRSIAYVAGVGVLYASPDGLVAISGPGRAQVITAELFSRQQWQALVPSSIIGIAHDNRYFGFYDTGSSKGGFILDFGAKGFGVTFLSFHASAVATEPLSDRLYMTIDASAPPGPPGSPAANQIVADGRTLYAFDDFVSGPLSAKLPYVWRSKTFHLPYPATLRYCRVVADGYDDLSVRLLDGESPYAQFEVTSEHEFVIPQRFASDGVRRFSFEVYGTAAVTSAQFAEDVDELV